MTNNPTEQQATPTSEEELLEARIDELEMQIEDLMVRYKKTGGVVKQTIINQENRMRGRVLNLKQELSKLQEEQK